jgi:ribonucleoside-diphosphate reductase alpha chain
VIGNRFDFESFRDDVWVYVTALDELIDENANNHALYEQTKQSLGWRLIGLGVMGLGETLIKLGITYGSEKSIMFIEKIFRDMYIQALLCSIDLAKQKGTYCMWNDDHANLILQSDFYKNLGVSDMVDEDLMKYGLRNAVLTTVAPTGSISTMLGVSGGIEPIFANYYTRTTKSLDGGNEKTFKVYTPIVQEYIKEHNLDNDNPDLPEYFVCAPDIHYIDRIKVQAAAQKYIDAAISSTINLPNSATVEDVENIYLQSWVHGLKGVTVFRDGCKRVGILNTSEVSNTNITQSVQKRPKKLVADCYVHKIKGKYYLFCVGILDGRPYELFIDELLDEHAAEELIKAKKFVCYITKVGKKHYQLNTTFGTFDNLGQGIEDETIKASALYISMLLRHNIDLNCITKIVDKAGYTVSSVSKVVNRVLSKYLADETLEDKCPDCGTALQRVAGCTSCPNCGHSRCG